MTRRLRVINDPDADAVKFPWHPVLDHKCDPPPVLNALMDYALLGLILVADGATASLCEKVNTGKAGESKAPTSSLAQTIDGFGRDYAKCRTNRRRLYVIREAQQHGIALRYAAKADPRLVRGSREWLEEIAKDTRPRRIVAKDFKVSSKTITKARQEFGVSHDVVLSATVA